MTSVNTRLTRNSSVTGLKNNVYDENAMILSKSITTNPTAAAIKKTTTTSTLTSNGAKRTTLGDLTNALQANQDVKKAAIKPTTTVAPTVTSNANKPATTTAAAVQPALRQRVPLKTSVVVPSKSSVTVAAPAATTLAAAKPKAPTANVGALGIVGSSFNYETKYAPAPQVIHEDEMLSDSEEEDESSEQIYDEDEGLEIQNEPTRSENGIKNIDVDPMEIEKETTRYHQHHIARAKTEEDFLDADDIEDIDMYDHDDPQFCTEYINLIFDYLRKKEVRDAASPLYMDKQVDIVEKHRTILVDWMAEVAVKFRLLTETFFLSINLVDRFLQFKAVARQKLQLVGITAMLLASKYEEIYTPEVRDFIWITAKAYTREEVLNMERNILVTLNFNLSTPTPLHFLRRFSKAARSDSKIHTLSKYITELSLLEYKMLEYLPSQIAAAAVYISRKMCGISPLWNSTLEFHTRYTEEDIMPCVRDLNAIVKKQETSKYRAIYKKYISPKLLAVATIPSCEDL